MIPQIKGSQSIARAISCVDYLASKIATIMTAVFNSAKAVVTWPFSTAKSLCGKASSTVTAIANKTLTAITSRMGVSSNFFNN